MKICNIYISIAISKPVNITFHSQHIKDRKIMTNPLHSNNLYLSTWLIFDVAQVLTLPSMGTTLAGFSGQFL